MVKRLLMAVLLIIVFLLAFLMTASYHAERSFEQSMIEMEKEK